ncbi:protein of unknown function [Vibrio tapetis subsp. tapetis]|uniref:Uncharacterized protein n=1 Tax=Vibrio tapetis subsp. tapetis TaxID=1671868 RepID=A0A2N8ZCC2_9VIBR|nr:protein of unknown function [Vibrio tapetis subsp. tapetis]
MGSLGLKVSARKVEKNKEELDESSSVNFCVFYFALTALPLLALVVVGKSENLVLSGSPDSTIKWLDGAFQPLQQPQSD